MEKAPIGKEKTKDAKTRPTGSQGFSLKQTLCLKQGFPARATGLAVDAPITLPHFATGCPNSIDC